MLFNQWFYLSSILLGNEAEGAALLLSFERSMLTLAYAVEGETVYTYYKCAMVNITQYRICDARYHRELVVAIKM